MPKQTHHHSIHLTDEFELLVKARIKAGRYRSLNAYFAALVRRETEFLSRGPCEECKVAEVVQTLLSFAKPKRKRKKKR